MKEDIKTTSALLSLLVLTFLLLPLANIEARRGCCSWHGGVCGCQCCDGTPLSSTCLPYYPGCGGGGFYNPPSYDYPSYAPTIPDCPLNSYYDSISDSCKCYSGYVVSGGKCISTDQYCRDKYGFNARYNILTDTCECRYGYVLSGGTCVDGDTVCHRQHGYNSYYDSLTDSCKCDYGYVFDSLDQCVSRDDYCQDLYGFNAEYDTLTDKCVCKRGYIVNSTKTRCINGDTYCRNEYGIHSSYDYWAEKCECDVGYLLSGNQCMDVDNYCQNLRGFHSRYNAITGICECNYGYKLKDGNCVAPEISKISPVSAGAGDEITVKGEHFGDTKYGDLRLYVGSVRVNLSDITRWRDDEIIFDIGDYLESGYVILKDNIAHAEARGSYLEILEPEQTDMFVYPFTPITKEKHSSTFQQITTESESGVESDAEPETREGVISSVEEDSLIGEQKDDGTLAEGTSEQLEQVEGDTENKEAEGNEDETYKTTTFVDSIVLLSSKISNTLGSIFTSIKTLWYELFQ